MIMLIPYLTAFLIHYFYNLKTKCDRKKQTSEIRIGLYTPKTTFFYVRKVISKTLCFGNVWIGKSELQNWSSEPESVNPQRIQI